MTQWAEVRTLARAKHAEAYAASGGVSARALLAAAQDLTGVGCQGLPANHPLLDRSLAQYDRTSEMIWFNQELSPAFAAFCQAHEFGHVWLHAAAASCSERDVDAEAVEEQVPYGVQRVEGYGPHERRECQANLFGREFLLPGDALRRWVMEDELTAAAIAARVGVPEGMVLHQLADALLAPPLPVAQAVTTSGAAELTLDRSQEEAAHVAQGPLLLAAGPGTGKTRTLLGRVAYLLGQDVPATAILALTFSNKAAEELRSRLALVAPQAAPDAWMGTFHAFGLELLRRFGARLGLSTNPRVLDPADALFFLERSLPALALHHYQNLYEPTLHLRDILAAISRAKDELVGPIAYAALAQQMRERASTEAEAVAAEQALEVAYVYAFYQGYLEREGLLDFGDLIGRAVDLLRTAPDVRQQLRTQYRHVLVDEYQDVNRASGLLLGEIAGDGAGLWVVGDPRQSIYRFRGAAPANMALFASDFPNARTLALKKNYRSQPAIVRLFGAFGAQMSGTLGTAFAAWDTDRVEDGGSVRYEVATDDRAEAAGIARAVERQHRDGVPYRDQAVLCRSHTTLARIAAGLERAGVPVLYLGNLFERPEVRDLLSLLALSCQADGRGLVRVARLPEYAIPLADVRTLLAQARNDTHPFPEAVQAAAAQELLSAGGRAALARLATQLASLAEATGAWRFLAGYLFTQSHYLQPLLADGSVTGQQRRLALYQFLQFAHGFEAGDTMSAEGGAAARRRFLHQVQRLEIFGEDKQLRQTPAWADGIDAVRLLTVHASKGLEFPVVYLPALTPASFPANRQYQPCPPPVGLLSAGTGNDHEDEEHCLFFVAMSRARDTLYLSRAQRYGKQPRKVSAFLTTIAGLLPRPVDGPATWLGVEVDADSAPTAARTVPGAPRTFWAEALDVYLACPRRYYYEQVLELEGKREDSAYVQFHRAVYAVLYWLQGERAAGREVDDQIARGKLAQAWEEQGPRGHAYEALYRQSAEDLVARALGRPARGRVRGTRRPWTVERPLGRIRLTPDHVELLEDGTELVQRLRTGRPSKSELEKPLYALYQVAPSEQPVGTPRRVELVFLAHDAVEAIQFSDRQVETRLAKYDKAMAGILTGQFPPEPDDRQCPRCPHYFICPAAEDGNPV